MKTVFVVVALVATGAVGWAIFGSDITDRAQSVKNDVRAQVENTLVELTEAIGPHK
jgi:hypothetical protein